MLQQLISNIMIEHPMKKISINFQCCDKRSMENFPSEVPAIVAPNIQIYLMSNVPAIVAPNIQIYLVTRAGGKWEPAVRTRTYKHIPKEKRPKKPGDICPKSLQLCCYTYAPHPHSQDLSTKFSIATCVHLASAKNRSTPSCAAVDHL